MGPVAVILPALLMLPDVDAGGGLRRVEDGVVLRRVDEGVADRGPLGLSLRDMQVDLAVPGGFEDVYRFAGRDGGAFGGRDELLMRQSGAVVATFDRSVYRRDKEGNTIIDVPPGTVFSIGFPRWMAETQLEAERIIAAERRDADVAALAGARALDGLGAGGRPDSRFDLRAHLGVRGSFRGGLDGGRSGSVAGGREDLRVDLAAPVGRAMRRPSRRTDGLGPAAPNGDRIELLPPSPTTDRELVASDARTLPPESGFELIEARRGVSEEAPRFTTDEAYRRMRLARLVRQAPPSDRSP